MAYGTRFTRAELEQIAAENEAPAPDDGTAAWTADDGTAASGTATMSVRLPVAVIAALKAAAEAEGTGATVLARRWITERLAATEPVSSATVNVADLLSFLAEHARGGTAA